MARNAFRIGGWIALIAGVLMAAAAATIAVVGVLALTGRVTYPVKVEVGPVSFKSTISMPVATGADVCKAADISVQDVPSDCFRYFMHDVEDDGECCGTSIRSQDANVRPTFVRLTGEAELATTGGWSPFVAALVARGVLGLAAVSATLLLLWRLLATAAAGDAFSARSVRFLRGIGWLAIAAAAFDPLLDHVISATHLGYSIESFGPPPLLQPWGSEGYPGGVNLAQLALGALVLLVAEIFRHGAEIEAERKLTV